MSARKLLGVMMLGLSTAAVAEPMDLTIDEGHSRIFFNVSHQGLSFMHGRFSRFDGTIVFDPDAPGASSINITIDPTSVDMFHADLNEGLRDERFFNTQTYPQIQFVSEKVERTGVNFYKITGNLTMLGQTRPVSFDVVHNKTGPDNDGDLRSGFSATGELDRREFGMTYGVPNLGAYIDFRIEIEATAADGT